MKNRIKIGASACLLGENVRYDGGHRHDRHLTDTMGEWFDFVPVCPETECGLGVPRETLRLAGDPETPRLVTTKTGIDHSDRMKRWVENRLDGLSRENLCGFVFKSKSPSCGMGRIKVHNPNGAAAGNQGAGLFARGFMDRFPRIPAEEESRFHDPKLRESFVEAVFVLKGWRELLCKKKTAGSLVEFHTRQKLLVLSHSETHYRLMGKLVAKGKSMPVPQLYDEYEDLLVAALKLKTTVKKNTNVLQHIMGYFKNQFSPAEKAELTEILENYRQGDIPLIVPATLLGHYARKYDQSYLKAQTYLNPHPILLKLKNHA